MERQPIYEPHSGFLTLAQHTAEAGLFGGTIATDDEDDGCCHDEDCKSDLLDWDERCLRLCLLLGLVVRGLCLDRGTVRLGGLRYGLCFVALREM